MTIDNFPENNRKRNAYHEAGHIVRAWDINPTCIGNAEIAFFVSRSFITTGEFNHIEKAKVAVAGALAEARAVSENPVGGNFVVVASRIAWHIDFRLDYHLAQWLPIPTIDD